MTQRGRWMPNDFYWDDLIGCGYFGTVYRGRYLGPGGCDGLHQLVAIKSLDKDRILREQAAGGSPLRMLQREISIHSS